MKFGGFITGGHAAEIAAEVRRAEARGLESVCIGEHLMVPTRSQAQSPYNKDPRFAALRENKPMHDPMLALAFAAALTTKVKLATGVFLLPLRNPFATARAVASLDVLSNGRLIFGVGIGWWAEEFEVIGANFQDRALRTREYLGLMKALWTQSDPVYEGKMARVKEVRFNPKPLQQPHPPIVLGGTTEPSLKRAARLGDGWYGVANSLAEAGGLIARLRAHEKNYPRQAPLELTLSLRTGHPLTLSEVKALADLGVDRTLFGTPLLPLRDEELTRLHQEVMAHFG